MLLTAALFTSLSLVQHFTCFPDDPYSNDRAVISLKFSENEKALPEVGTLFLSSGLDSEGNQESSGVLKMKIEDAKTRVADEAIAYSGEDSSSRYKVTLPASAIGRASNDLRVKIELENIDHTNHGVFEMSCYSSLHGGSGSPRGVN